MVKQTLIDQIISVEWDMFAATNNAGGKADCQEDPKTFHIMRDAQFQAWSEILLAAYQQDLAQAAHEGRNPLSEKYGYMMRWTYPEEYEQIKEYLPPISEEKHRLIIDIIQIQMKQTAEFMREYPFLANNGRPIYHIDGNATTSIEVYGYGEMATYSMHTLELFYNYLIQLDNDGQNYQRMIVENTIRAYGYQSLDEAEKASRWECRKCGK